jgi:predicted ArsR family transcriptional regulator
MKKKKNAGKVIPIKEVKKIKRLVGREVDKKMDEVLEFMKGHSDMSLRQMAIAMGMSPQLFHKYYRKIVKMGAVKIQQRWVIDEQDDGEA